jgi:putative SOS response-associated peptidase YedK
MAKRCLIIADGWFEWPRTNNYKQPYFFQMNDDLLSFAGIYTEYNGEKGCAIITKESTKQLSEVHLTILKFRFPALSSKCLSLGYLFFSHSAF